jgi:hypothetical protein
VTEHANVQRLRELLAAVDRRERSSTRALLQAAAAPR